MKIKRTVVLNGITPQIGFVIGVVEMICLKYGKEAVVTSAKDGVHSKNSLHYSGNAIDFRSKHLATYKHVIYQELRTVLDRLGYDCLFESQGKDNEHFHIEYDPKLNEQWFRLTD